MDASLNRNLLQRLQSPSEYLRELIRAAGGAISVERFMHEALYHPNFGYYAQQIRRIGKGGDFSTSATLDSALPQAIANWALAHRSEVCSNAAWHVIELGGGGGQMADAFLHALSWFTRLRLTYHIVELSDPLRALQQDRLRRWKNTVRWHSGIVPALDGAKGRALIFSNEFVDAFPCVQLARDVTAEHGWREVMIVWPPDAPAPSEVLAPWNETSEAWQQSSAANGDNLQRIFHGRRVEIHLTYQRWLESWLPHWRAGRMLTVDYGDTFPVLYHRQSAGTLRGYAHHQRRVGAQIYEYFGQQDLTADVNFTDLQGWGEMLGLETTAFCSQADFLRTKPPEKRLFKQSARTPALDFLLDESGAGSAFKVLEQRKLAQIS